MKLAITGISLLLFAGASFAQTTNNALLNAAGMGGNGQVTTSSFPANCSNQGFSIQGKEAILNTDTTPTATQRIYLIHNQSAALVMLNHQTTNPGASAGWLSKLNPNQWSAIAVDQKSFSLSCLAYLPPQVGYVNCANVISVCGYPAQNKGGSFWVGENQSLQNILAVIQQRQVLSPAGK